MPEITIDIVWANKRRGSQYESLVDVKRDGELIIGGALVSSPVQLTEDQIVDKAIDSLYMPISSPEEFD